METIRSLTPHLPTYPEIRHFIQILDGISTQMYRDMFNSIMGQSGTPQAQLDWSTPDNWIPQRLEGDSKGLALKLWHESKGVVNPRHVRGCWYFSTKHDLLSNDGQRLAITEKGREFVDNINSSLLGELDNYEGLLTILAILEQNGASKFIHILPQYGIFCRSFTRYKSDRSITAGLRGGLPNLMERNLVERKGQLYSLTKEGRAHLNQHRNLVPDLSSVIEQSTELSNDSVIAIEEKEESEVRSLTPGLPTYNEVKWFIKILDRVPYDLYRSTYNEIWDQRGSPQQQVDWANPDSWIPERLQGDEAKLALRFWTESKHILNPRYLRGSWYLSTKHNLLKKASDGLLTITSRGQEFIKSANSQIIREIDEYEGISLILRLVAERGPDRSKMFLEEYAAFCRQYTGYKSETPIRGSLYDRLINLISRDLVERNGQIYKVTQDGLNYLEKQSEHSIFRKSSENNNLIKLRRLAKEIQDSTRKEMLKFLRKMDPYKFEYLIKFLLEEIGYRNVIVTSSTNDKGVDVIADIDLGISSVREVIQVKRHKGNIHRPTLDQLRGSLHRFNAVRGTIITVGGFSKGTVDAAFERGAAPITLIDGENLLNLLIENNIGISKQKVEYFEFDSEQLMQFDSGDADEPEV